MALKIQTFDMPLSPPVESLHEDVLIELAVAPDSLEILDLSIKSAPYPLKPEVVATETITFPAAPKICKVEIKKSIPKKVATTNIKFKPANEVETITVPVKLSNLKVRIRKIVCKSPDDMKTYKNTFLDHAPIGREMLEKRFIPFPMLSDFMGELAKRHKTSYTNINFIGAFDPIPLHLAEKFTIDPVFGILKFYMRKEPKGERRFARVVYGRRRDNGEIVSAVFPVT